MTAMLVALENVSAGATTGSTRDPNPCVTRGRGRVWNSIGPDSQYVTCPKLPSLEPRPHMCYCAWSDSGTKAKKWFSVGLHQKKTAGNTRVVKGARTWCGDSSNFNRKSVIAPTNPPAKTLSNPSIPILEYFFDQVTAEGWLGAEEGGLVGMYENPNDDEAPPLWSPGCGEKNVTQRLPGAGHEKKSKLSLAMEHFRNKEKTENNRWIWLCADKCKCVKKWKVECDEMRVRGVTKY